MKMKRTDDLRTPVRATGVLPASVAIVGAGRLGTALATALRAAGVGVLGPFGRGAAITADAVVLCVPDSEIGAAAQSVAGAAPLVGHTSGATPLSALEPAATAGAAVFGLHPLQTFDGVPAADPLAPFAGVGCAVAGSDATAAAVAAGLARDLGMRPFALSDAARPAYHAAASTASNFLVTLEDAAERIAAGAGLDPATARSLLAPLVRATVSNWSERGPEAALTGPVARGDDATVAAQRAAVAAADDDLLDLFDALVASTRALAGRRAEVPA